MNTIDTEVVAQQVEEIGWLNAVKALLDRHRQEHGIDSPLVLVMSDHDETGDQWEASLITPSAKRSGYWQVSTLAPMASRAIISALPNSSPCAGP